MTESTPPSPSRRNRRGQRIEVHVTSAAPIGYDTCMDSRESFSTPSAAAQFAVAQAAALDFDSTGITVTITGDGADDVCVFGTPGEIACALAAVARYAAGVRKAHTAPPRYRGILTQQTPPPEYLHEAVDEVAGPIQWQCGNGPEAVVDVRVRSVRPDPLPDSTFVLGPWLPDVAYTLAHDLARSITEHSGDRSPATVTHLLDQDRYEIIHPVSISDVDAAAVARYIRITQLRANLAALDPVADADSAVSLAAELHVLESHSRRAPSPDDRTVR